MLYEEAFFYLGNIYYRMDKYEEAIDCYEDALLIRQSFSEVKWNIALSYKMLSNIDEYYEIIYKNKLEIFSSTEDIIDSLYLHSQLTVTDFSTKEEIKNIPIFINAFNRLNCLKKLIEWLENNEYNNIFILDNNSTYPPLLEYYDALMRSNNKSIKVIFLKKNLGHTSLWESQLLEKLDIKTPYIYTDPDTIPTQDCGEECIPYLLKILRENPLIKKAGLGIKVDDITYFDKEATQNFERQYWKYSFNKNDYFAAVDTTFAVYRNIRYYTLANSIRSGYPHLCKHLPFYLDYDNLSEDEQYYLEHANVSASLITDIKKHKLPE